MEDEASKIYPDSPLMNVHRTTATRLKIEYIRDCPVCQQRISLLHDEAINYDKRFSPRGFELKG